MKSVMNKDTELQRFKQSEYGGIYLSPPRFFEENDGISTTEQNVEMTLREMVERYVQAGEIPVSNDSYYDEDPDNIIPAGFDLSDVTEAQNVINDESIIVSDAKTATNPKRSERATATKPLTDGGGTTTEGGGSVAVPTTAPAVGGDE